MKKMKSKPWKRTEWMKKRTEYIKGKKCEVCNSTEKLVIHHPQAEYSLTNEQYESFNGTQIVCRRCHLAYHKGYELCPKCKQNYVKPNCEVCFKCSGKPQTHEKYKHPLCGKEFLINTKLREMGKELFGSDTHDREIFDLCLKCGKMHECATFKKWYDAEMEKEDQDEHEDE